MAGTDRFDLKNIKMLAEMMSGFGLACKRIAFHGKINHGARDCIVSLPGICPELWDQAVYAVTNDAPALSLACVSLTDKASGLGQHAGVPDLKGGCWCHMIYGDMQPSDYLLVVDVNELQPGDNEQELLDFKRADAEAMGQHLIIKRDQSELEWQKELCEALVYAEELCRQNSGRAPWGCQWFEDWRVRVQEAVKNHQTLHVFYFEKKVGQGKMDWEDLCNEKARDIASKDTGLGKSQTAEVAYLTLNNIEFEEHDILDFEDLMFGKSASSHTAVFPENGDDSTAAVWDLRFVAEKVRDVNPSMNPYQPQLKQLPVAIIFKCNMKCWITNGMLMHHAGIRSRSTYSIWF